MRIVLAILALTTAATAFAETPAWVRVRSLAYAGTGCRAGAVTAAVVSKDVVALFDALNVAAGPGIPRAEAQKNCQLVFDLDVPPGWSYALKAVDWATPASISSGATLTFQLAHYYAGAGSTATFRHSQSGPFAGRIEAHLASTALLWSPCGARRGLNLNMALRTQALTPRAWITIPDAIDGPELKLRFAWRRCDAQ